MSKEAFFINSEHNLSQLATWLGRRPYNKFNRRADDKCGNAVLGLSWSPSRSSHISFDKLGLIVVKDPALIPAVESLLGKISLELVDE